MKAIFLHFIFYKSGNWYLSDFEFTNKDKPEVDNIFLCVVDIENGKRKRRFPDA